MKQMVPEQKPFFTNKPLRYDGVVSVIIPCRNERGNIQSALDRCPELGSTTEFIFVEGNSVDDTPKKIKRVVAQRGNKTIYGLIQSGKGKGDAVRKGFAHARGDILIILDGDLTVPPEEIPLFVDALVQKKADFINGTRLVYPMETQAMGRLAWIANHFFGRLISLIIGQRITDTLCGTKVLWKKDYDHIAANRNKLGLHDPFGDFDLLFGAAYLKLKIAEVPIHYKARTYGKTNISRFKEVWFLLWMCMRGWWAFRRRP